MEPSSVAEVLLVRAVETGRPDAIPPEELVDAAAAAGPLDDEGAWLGRRAAYLCAHSLRPYRSLLSMTSALDRSGRWVLGLAVAAGLSTNYLGPSARINVLYNPITFLIAWNLAVLVARGAGLLWLRPRATSSADAEGRAVDARSAPPTERARGGEAPGARPAERTRHAPVAPRPLRWLLRWSVPTLWVRTQRWSGATRAEAKGAAAVARAFWSEWMRTARPLLGLRVRQLLHVAAIGLALGATAGMFVRGLFFEYDVVWRSTFIREPETAAAVLRVGLAPACAVLGHPFPDTATARALMGPEGLPAAEWIWLYAVSALLAIGIPRGALWLAVAARLREARRALLPDLSDPKLRHPLEAARALHLDELEEAVRADVRTESAKLAESVAAFVCERLYDPRVAPRLRRFREEGGTLDGLEDAIAEACREFQPALEAFVPRAQEEFEEALAAAVARTVGARVAIERAERLGERVGGASSDSARHTGASLARGLADVVGATVSAAAAVTAGTVSGGFGKVLGAAVVVHLLGTTGPVGFVIGALGGLLAAAAAWWLGRDRVAGSLRGVRWPGRVTRLVLRPGRLERLVAEGRERCHDTVRELIDAELAPLTPRLAENLWREVKGVLGERQRPDPG